MPQEELNMKVESLYRYPVKGLTPERLAHAALTPGRCIPWDRAFALNQGDSAFDFARPGWVPKSNFMCLLKNARVAALKTRFDDASGLLTILTPDGALVQESPLTEAGRAALTDFFVAYLGKEARFGPNNQAPQFVHVKNHSFCDHRTQVISLIGLGSLGALESAVGAPRDKRRFRANIYIENLAPWTEFDWLGRKIRIGEVEAIVQERIDRCGATTVNPDTAERDANPVLELKRNFGHIELGVFAEILTQGTIREGDEITLLT
jgi:uncharacterized protein YcbX